jgi:hypothetical protein
MDVPEHFWNLTGLVSKVDVTPYSDILTGHYVTGMVHFGNQTLVLVLQEIKFCTNSIVWSQVYSCKNYCKSNGFSTIYFGLL